MKPYLVDMIPIAITSIAVGFACYSYGKKSESADKAPPSAVTLTADSPCFDVFFPESESSVTCPHPKQRLIAHREKELDIRCECPRGPQ